MMASYALLLVLLISIAFNSHLVVVATKSVVKEDGRGRLDEPNGDVPTLAPTVEAFVLSYTGSATAGFGGSYEGNEVTLSFLASPQFDKEISLLFDNCTTFLPDDGLLTATAEDTPAGNGGNLRNYAVHIALNLEKLGLLQKDNIDNAIWKGSDDSTSSILTFCVRVDLILHQDLVAGDGSANKTSVNFESVQMEVAIDFTTEVPAISGVTDGQSVQQVIVDADVYGVSACHCNVASSTCYNNEVGLVAPALTLDDSLNVCLFVTATGVAIDRVTSFRIEQGGFTFDAIKAGSVFYTVSYQGSFATFTSKLPSVFFTHANVDLTVTAEFELDFRSERRLTPVQDITSDPYKDVSVMVIVQVEGVRLTTDDKKEEEVKSHKKSQNSSGDGNLTVWMVLVVVVVCAVGIVTMTLAFMSAMTACSRRRRLARAHPTKNKSIRSVGASSESTFPESDEFIKVDQRYIPIRKSSLPPDRSSSKTSTSSSWLTDQQEEEQVESAEVMVISMDPMDGSAVEMPHEGGVEMVPRARAA